MVLFVLPVFLFIINIHIIFTMTSRLIFAIFIVAIAEKKPSFRLTTHSRRYIYTHTIYIYIYMIVNSIYTVYDSDDLFLIIFVLFI